MAMVQYNGVVLPYPVFTHFDHRVLYDDVGNTDWYCTQYDLSVQCMIHHDYLQMLAPQLQGQTQNPADILAVIKSRLMRPRRPLSVTFNGIELIPQATAGVGYVDVRNGPQPQSCTLHQVTNTSFLLNFHIIAHYWENNTLSGTSPAVTNTPSSPILYNRWEESMDLDQMGFGVRRRTGKFVMRSDNPDQTIVDVYRDSLAVVGIPQGFVRESASYTASPDGLGLQYSIVDREVYKPPPDPAFWADGEYSEQVTRAGQARIGQVRVHLKGSKGTNQTTLINTAVGICLTKLKNQEPGLNRWNYLEFANVRHKLYQSEVEVTMAAWMPGTPARLKIEGGFGAVAAFVGMSTYTPESDDNPDYIPDHPSWGSSNYVLRAAAYYDPNIIGNSLAADTHNMTDGLWPGEAGVVREPDGPNQQG